MKRSEAEQAMNEGREVLRLRPRGIGSGESVRITGIGYRQSNWGGEPVKAGTGVLVEHLDRDGQGTGRCAVYPLSQLRLTTRAEREAELERQAAIQAEAARERYARQRADQARAEVLAGQLGGRASNERYGDAVYVRLTLAQAEEVVARLRRLVDAAHGVIGEVDR